MKRNKGVVGRAVAGRWCAVAVAEEEGESFFALRLEYQTEVDVTVKPF